MAAAATGIEERLLIGGEWVEAARWRPLRRHRSGDRRSRRHGARRRRERCPGRDRRGLRSARGVEDVAGARSRPHPPACGRPHPRAPRHDRARHDVRAGEAARRGGGRGRLRRELPRVVRRRGGAGVRPDRSAHEPRESRPRAATAGRSDGGDHAVELPGGDDDAQARACDGGRLHERGQARERDTAHRRLDSSRDRGRRDSSRGRQPDHIPLVRDGRPAAVLGRARPEDLVHRLHRGGQGADPGLGRPGQAALARARWPRAVRDLRRRGSRRGRRRADRVQVPKRRPDLRLREPHVRAGRRLRRRRREARGEGHARWSSGTARKTASRSGRSSTTAPSTRPTSTSRTRSRAVRDSSSAASACGATATRAGRSTRRPCSRA